MLRQASCFVPSFPRGLIQPQSSFRFSVDALLPAAFAEGAGAKRAADLGAGCGVGVLALLLRFPNLACLGVEREADLIAAAQENAQRFNCVARAHFARGDLADRGFLESLGRGAFDLATANPPYRLAGAGRPSPSLLRREALTGSRGSLRIFVNAAAFLLRRHGRFVCVFTPARLGELLACLEAADLGPRRLRAVHARPGAAAKFVLVEARKEAKADLVLEAPLTLYAGERGRELSAEARALGLG